MQELLVDKVINLVIVKETEKQKEMYQLYMKENMSLLKSTPRGNQRGIFSNFFLDRHDILYIKYAKIHL